MTYRLIGMVLAGKDVVSSDMTVALPPKDNGVNNGGSLFTQKLVTGAPSLPQNNGSEDPTNNTGPSAFGANGLGNTTQGHSTQRGSGSALGGAESGKMDANRSEKVKKSRVCTVM
ncbi:hypothetical protein BASA50_007688 [Batrachochytrium salamandrivorans]|uniref:Uncharacterized protein n=1 Tax=Batrachochytrium salamandrivorans TaxID=1357716 RepID=A0ABQ8F689_9FUNG|nr:hypothetical protein BASA60_005428 [Batrachochytrium salamandrivorans]KAH6592961.1 hypothetical protein BASA50_007688 [Batrachochytrium salamandrivorans]KAH9246565.1 hypothetical protein BASA81_015884 [Batrachochytrium salamandrivorans]KAH9247422.1 hypothetical protein BASA81_014984 [Batrachochytrium salamandrivorans]